MKRRERGGAYSLGPFIVWTRKHRTWKGYRIFPAWHESLMLHRIWTILIIFFILIYCILSVHVYRLCSCSVFVYRNKIFNSSLHLLSLFLITYVIFRFNFIYFFLDKQTVLLVILDFILHFLFIYNLKIETHWCNVYISKHLILCMYMKNKI